MPPTEIGMLEKDFGKSVEEYATLKGWKWFHVTQSSISLKSGRRVGDPKQSGFPDYVFVRERIIYRELKRDNTYLKPTQKAWGQAITEAGGDWAVWRPRDWAEIERTLA